MNRTTVEEIKARLSIEDVIGSYVKLEKAGKSFKAKCPFHNEKTASFFISPERGGYYCFGCGAKGDIFSFVEQFEGLDFRGALKILADKAGVPLVFDRKADGERDRMLAAMEEAAKYFELQLDRSREAQEYVRGRGISDTTRKTFRIGWAPDGWRNVLVYLNGKGYDNAILEKIGLIKMKDPGTTPGPSNIDETHTLGGDTSRSEPSRRGSVGSRSERVAAQGVGLGTSNPGHYYDRFRGRIMFPIFDSSGRVIAFSGRILRDDGQSAKYLNSPDTPLYDKSAVLYGLDKAKSEIRRLNYSIFVEGQMDLVMSHQAGIRNTVASSGTALGGEAFGDSGVVSNLGLVRRLSPNIIIAFDADAAGRKAAMRAAAIALGIGMDVKIADIRGGKDPADLVRENAENWKEVLRSAKPVVEFELTNTLRDITDLRKRTKAIQERVLPLVATIESGGDQSYFVQMIADQAKIPVDIVWQDLRVVEKRIKQSGQNATNQNSNAQKNASTETAVRTSGEQNKRIDLVERRLFGLIHLMEKEGLAQAVEFRKQLEKIAGDSYDSRKAKAEKVINDLVFEAEALFGNDRDQWQKHIGELLYNFEEDIVNEELVRSMQELKAAERDGDKGKLAEFAAKCQALSVRKAQINKNRLSK